MAFCGHSSSKESHQVVLSVGVRCILSHVPLTFRRPKLVKENNVTTANRHAAQIIAEMLEQVWHRKLFENPNKEYQEVNSRRLVPKIPRSGEGCGLHIRRLLFIFGTRESISSTENLSTDHGAQYFHLFPTFDDKIKLCQFEGYSMKNFKDHVRLFHELSKLL